MYGQLGLQAIHTVIGIPGEASSAGELEFAGLRAGFLLGVLAIARAVLVFCCLWAFCYEHGCDELPLISTVTGGYQDKSDCPLKSWSYWLTWSTVAVQNVLLWAVLRDVYPKESQSCIPKLWRVSFHLLLVLDIAQQTCRIPGYHADLVIMGFALAVIVPGGLLHALRRDGANAQSPCALTIAWMAWFLLGLTGLYLCTWEPTLDHHFRAIFVEYVALVAYSIMIAALGQVPWTNLSFAREKQGSEKTGTYAACSS
jgi:hypothetical protein